MYGSFFHDIEIFKNVAIKNKSARMLYIFADLFSRFFR